MWWWLPLLSNHFCPPVTVPETHSGGVEEEGCVYWVLLTTCDEAHMKLIAPCHLAIKVAACLSSKQRLMHKVSSNGHRLPCSTPPDPTSPHDLTRTCPIMGRSSTFHIFPRIFNPILNSIKASLRHHSRSHCIGINTYAIVKLLTWMLCYEWVIAHIKTYLKRNELTFRISW